MTPMILGMATIATIVLLYIGCIAIVSYHESGTAPTTPMYLCDRHGAFPVVYAVEIVVADGAPVKVCPMCLELQNKVAQERYGSGAA